MTNNSIALLSDRELLEATTRVVDRERRTTAELVALLAEVDARKLYLGEKHPSLFAYCTLALHLSEPAAYSRITAARAARRFPAIFTLLAEGEVTLTTVGLLAPHLTIENHESLLGVARHKSKRDVERLVACLHPQPDIPSSVRRLRATGQAEGPALLMVDEPLPGGSPRTMAVGQSDPAPALAIPASARRSLPRPSERTVIAPLAPERYLLRITMSRETHAKLERARDLLRHAIPHGDPAAVVDRALSVLVEQLERVKLAATPRPRSGHVPASSRSRRVPSAVRRAVWARDEDRCAFVGSNGRCAETGFLEFHHVVPYAAGGATDIDNLQLRCRAHNEFEADDYFGKTRRQLVAAAVPSSRVHTVDESILKS